MNAKPIFPLTLALGLTTQLPAEDADLAKKLSNPVADLISVPIQSNCDFGIGPGDGTKWTTNFQPVIPIELSENSMTGVPTTGTFRSTLLSASL